MCNYTFEYIIRISIYREAGTLAFYYTAYISFIHIGYYLHLCLERYNGDVATAAAAYHSGWGTVDNLLRMEEHSADGQTLQGFPYSQMNHYVNKITSCYGAYQRIYAGN